MIMKNLFIYTNNLNFFYKLNRELIRLNVKFEILTVRSKFYNLPSIVLTTSEEIHKFDKNYKNLKILPYYKDENFHHYILKILAAYKIEFKENYSNLTFSIDPGTSQIGIAVFLDDFFLQSHTIYKKEQFIEVINDYILCFQKEGSNPMLFTFKFGRGVIPITIDLLKRVYETFKNRKSIKVYLIDESRTSKIKIQDKEKLVRTKHEVSALIIAMRKGIEVDSLNYLQIIRQNKFQNPNYQKNENNDLDEVLDKTSNLKEIMKKLLDNDISLNKSSELINELKHKPL